MLRAIGIGDSATTKTRVGIGTETGNVDGSELAILKGRRHEVMEAIVKSGGATPGLTMSLRRVTREHQIGELRSPPIDVIEVCLRLETAVALRRLEQSLARPHLTDPRQLAQAPEVHPGGVLRLHMSRETKLHVSALTLLLNIYKYVNT